MLDVDPMSAGGDAIAVSFEVAVPDRDRTGRPVVRENSVFVSDEAAVLDGDVRSFDTNTGAVVILHLGALEGQAAYENIARIDNEDSLVAATPVRDDRAIALDRDARDPFRPNGAVDIGSGRDVDDVAG